MRGFATEQFAEHIGSPSGDLVIEGLMGIRYSTTALVKAGFVGGGRHLQLATKADPDRALEALRSASATAEALHIDEDDVVATMSITRAPGGPILYMHLCDSAALLEEYLHVLARELEAAGLSGRLLAAKSVDSPRVYAPTLTAVLQLTLDYQAMLAHPHDYGAPDPNWWVSQDRTMRVVPPLVDWCLQPEGEVYLYTGIELRLDPGDVTPILLDSLRHNARAELRNIAPDRRWMRRLRLHESGGVFAQTYAPDQPWQTQLDTLQPVLRGTAADVANAFVRPLGSTIGKRNEAWRQPPATPLSTQWGGVGSRLWSIAHLDDEYLPDAYAQQVVTDHHLHRLGHLPTDRWHIEHLGDHRHLITARDPQPWLDVDPRPYTKADNDFTRPAPPDQATLTQARDDFAPAILTLDVLEAHPAPEVTGPQRPL